MNMKKQALLAASLAVLGGTSIADELDQRWYLSGGLSYTFTDSDRDISVPRVKIENAPGGFVGIGKAINEWLNLELNLKGQHADLDGAGGSWKQYGATVDGLWFFNRSTAFAPFAVLGVGALQSDLSGVKKDTSPVVEAGLGFMRDIDDDGAKLRVEARHRWDFADINIPGGNSTFNDWIVMAGVSIPIGHRPQSAAEPRPVVTMAEPTPAPAPAPVPVTETVVLKGVNFCFDCDTLSGEARQILDTDAMAIVKHHPNATFEVAGHTDAKGSDAYNQGLSQRRAGSVRAYLVEQGVDASRMTAVGYGESQPVADNASDAGRAENRRVELRITETR